MDASSYCSEEPAETRWPLDLQATTAASDPVSLTRNLFMSPSCFSVYLDDRMLFSNQKTFIFYFLLKSYFCCKLSYLVSVLKNSPSGLCVNQRFPGSSGFPGAEHSGPGLSAEAGCSQKSCPVVDLRTRRPCFRSPARAPRSRTGEIFWMILAPTSKFEVRAVRS